MWCWALWPGCSFRGDTVDETVPDQTTHLCGAGLSRLRGKLSELQSLQFPLLHTGLRPVQQASWLRSLRRPYVNAAQK